MLSLHVDKQFTEILNIESLTTHNCSEIMHNTRLVRLLGTLDPKNRKRFTNYLESPYFGSQRMHRILYRHLEKYFVRRDKILKVNPQAPQTAPKLERIAKILDREKVLRSVYPGVDEEAAYKNLRRLSSELLDHWENFLLMEKNQGEHYTFAKKMAALEQIGESEPELFQRETQKLAISMDKVNERDLPWYQLRFQLTRLQSPPSGKEANLPVKEQFNRWLKKQS